MLQFAYDSRHELWLCYEEVCLSDTVVLSDIRLPLNYDKKPYSLQNTVGWK